ncbi:MAG: ATP-binding protein [Thermodesulfobacteriota bacterium]
MKISVCGKGGSGKSTIVTLLANQAKARGYRVLVVDSDESNSGLFRILGFEQPPVPLMELVGGKKKVQEKMKKGYSADEAETAMRVMTQEAIKIQDIPNENILQKDNLYLVSIGKILQSLEGCACPMGVLSREFLRKLSLSREEIAIVDMEAGVEHFGRGVETSIDSVLIVVEPSFESLQLTERIHSLSRGIGIDNIWAILSKVPSNGIASRLKGELDTKGIDIIGCIHYDEDIFQSSLEGLGFVKGKASSEIVEVFDSIISRANPGD